MRFACLPKISYTISQNTEAWLVELADISYHGLARRSAPRERLPLVNSVWLNFHWQKRDNYQMCSPKTAIVC